MAFAINATGIERGATQFAPAAHPTRVLNRYAESTVDRVVTLALEGTPMVTEMPRATTVVMQTWRWEVVTETELAKLVTIRDAVGTVVAKRKSGAAATFDAALAAVRLGPVIGDYTDTAPSTITPHWVEIDLIPI